MKSIRLLTLLTLLTVVATAQPNLQLTLSSAKVVSISQGGTNVSGEGPADQAMSGDVVIYRIAYVNVGDAPANNPSLTGIIPEGTVIRPEESRPESALITYSIDGAKTFLPYPITENRTTNSGVTVARSIPLTDYSHVRFKLQRSVAPGESGQVEFRVTIE